MLPSTHLYLWRSLFYSLQSCVFVYSLLIYLKLYKPLVLLCQISGRQHYSGWLTENHYGQNMIFLLDSQLLMMNARQKRAKYA